MLITVLSVPECPNAPVLLQRVNAALAGRRVSMRSVVVPDESAAMAWGMCGSPTLLVNGTDPFRSATAEPSLSCRLYPGEDGSLSGAPSVEAVRRALSARPAAEADPPGPWLDPLDRAGRGRRAPAEGGLRAMQRAILLAVGSTGSLPATDQFDRAAAGSGRSAAQVLAALAELDYLSLDGRGMVRAAYPFSLVPTRHRVAIAEGPTVWSMCAIDALGISAMLRRAVRITSSDPVTGQRILVEATPGGAQWDPPGAIVFVGRTGDGPAEAVCCGLTNFYASAHSAARWAALHPGVSEEQLDQAEALELGQTIFGAVLEI